MSIGLYQDEKYWATDTAILFAASLVALVTTFPTHFLTTSEDFNTSKRRVMWRLLAGKKKKLFFLRPVLITV